jgi:gas vesicle protein
MSEGSSTSSKLAYFLIGGGIGAVIALLFAPRSGKETREIIAQKAVEGKELLTSAGKNVSESVSTYLEKGKEVVNTQRDQLTAAIEAGKQAYRDEKAKSQTIAE